MGFNLFPISPPFSRQKRRKRSRGEVKEKGREMKNAQNEVPKVNEMLNDPRMKNYSIKRLQYAIEWCKFFCNS